MEVTVITGAQGAGKNEKAYEVNGLGNRFIEFDADDFTKKSTWDGLENANSVIIDCVHSDKQIGQIQNLIQRGNINYRIPYAKESKDYEIKKLIIISQWGIAGEFPTAKHIKL